MKSIKNSVTVCALSGFIIVLIAASTGRLLFDKEWVEAFDSAYKFSGMVAVGYVALSQLSEDD